MSLLFPQSLSTLILLTPPSASAGHTELAPLTPSLLWKTQKTHGHSLLSLACASEGRENTLLLRAPWQGRAVFSPFLKTGLHSTAVFVYRPSNEHKTRWLDPALFLFWHVPLQTTQYIGLCGPVITCHQWEPRGCHVQESGFIYFKCYRQTDFFFLSAAPKATPTDLLSPLASDLCLLLMAYPLLTHGGRRSKSVTSC